MSPLRRQMIEDLSVRGLAENTHKAYLHAVSQLAQYYNKRPDQLSTREVQRFLVHLREERGLAWSSCNLYGHALRFFYRVTLGRAAVDFYIPCAKQEQRLPEILSRQEIQRLFRVTANRRDRALLMTTYGAGLRASEVICLKISDIDSDRMSLRIDQGKGRKDRYSLLSERLLLNCVAIGCAIVLNTGCSLAGERGVRSHAKGLLASIIKPRPRLGSTRPAASIACVIPLPPICSRLRRSAYHPTSARSPQPSNDNALFASEHRPFDSSHLTA